MADQVKQDATDDNVIRVFVYGTLKQGNGNHNALAGAEFLGRHFIEGNYTLIDMGWYPGLVRGGERQRVFGEVYRVSEDVLHTLDLIEGHPNFYERVKVATPWKNAWVYTLDASYLEGSTKEHIDGGVWRPKPDEVAYVESVRQAV